MTVKVEDEWTEDEKRMAQDYLRKVRELAEERDKYRKVMHRLTIYYLSLMPLDTQDQEHLCIYTCIRIPEQINRQMPMPIDTVSAVFHKWGLGQYPTKPQADCNMPKPPRVKYGREVSM